MSIEDIKKTLKENVLTTSNTFLVIALAGLIALHKPIENLLTSITVNPILQHIESSPLNDLLAGFVCIIVIAFTIIRLKYYHVSNQIILTATFFFVYYIYYRFRSGIWVYTSFSIAKSIRYADLIFLFEFSLLALWLRSYFTKINGLPAKSFFNNDAPIKNPEEDKLGYKTYTKQIAEGIIKSGFETSFAIGINAPWGLGKTSFINMIKSELKKEDVIIIDVNPWYSRNSDTIIQDFFENFHDSLSQYHSNIKGQLITYSKKLTEFDDNYLTKISKLLSDTFEGDNSINSLFDDINSSLKKIDKKVVVFIDDVDRLDKNEVVEIIRLVRNTANFYNTFFVVAYDRSFVINALSSLGVHNHEDFLEKIFQLEVTLPQFNREILRNDFEISLSKIFPDSMNDKLKEAIYGKGISKNDYLTSWLENFRDVNRLSNSIRLNVAKLTSEIDIEDFILIELLRLKHPAVHELLHKNTKSYLGFPQNNNGPRRYILLQENNVACIENYLNNEHEKICIREKDIKKIMSLLNSLFSNENLFSNYSHLSIQNPDRFKLYFSYDRLSDVLSEEEFVDALILDYDKLKVQIDTWINNGLQFELRKRLEEVNSFSSREIFETFVRGIFYMANLESKYRSPFTRGFVSYDIKKLYYLINYKGYNNMLKQLYGDSSEGEKEYRFFIDSIFKTSDSPAYFQADFLAYVSEEFVRDEESFIDVDDIKQYSLSYLKTACEVNKELNSSIWYYYNRCKRKLHIPSGTNSYSVENSIYPERKEILIDFIEKKDLDGYLYATMKINDHKKGIFKIDTSTGILFDSKEEFVKFVLAQNDSSWKYLKEYKAFLNKLIDNNYEYTEYRFAVIPVENLYQERIANTYSF